MRNKPKGSNFALCHVSGRRSDGGRPRIVEWLGPEDSRLDIIPVVPAVAAEKNKHLLSIAGGRRGRVAPAQNAIRPSSIDGCHLISNACAQGLNSRTDSSGAFRY